MSCAPALGWSRANASYTPPRETAALARMPGARMSSMKPRGATRFAPGARIHATQSMCATSDQAPPPPPCSPYARRKRFSGLATSGLIAAATISPSPLSPASCRPFPSSRRAQRNVVARGDNFYCMGQREPPPLPAPTSAAGVRSPLSSSSAGSAGASKAVGACRAASATGAASASASAEARPRASVSARPW